MKRITFDADLIPAILSGEKRKTWRMFDHRDLHEGDVFLVVNNDTHEEYVPARITRIVEKPLGSVRDEDFDGHRTYASEEEMFARFRQFYGERVTLETPVKIIDFVLLATP